MSFDVRGGVMRARCWGPASGPRWIAFHGWLDNANSFEPLARYLPNLRLVAVDMAGHGQSAWRPMGAYHLCDFAADGYAILEKLGWLETGCNVMGHSLGSGVAMLLASTLGPQCGRLVLLDALGPIASPEREAPDILRSALHDLGSPPAQKAYPNLQAAAHRRQQGNVVGTISLEAATLLCLRGCKPAPSDLAVAPKDWMDHPVIWSADPTVRLKSRMRLSPSSTAAFCRSLKCPTLCILPKDGLLKPAMRWGILDGSLLTYYWLLLGLGPFFRALLWLARLFKRAKWVKYFDHAVTSVEHGIDLITRVRSIGKFKVIYFPEGGHHVHMTRAGDISRHIVDWLQQP